MGGTRGRRAEREVFMDLRCLKTLTRALLARNLCLWFSVFSVTCSCPFWNLFFPSWCCTRGFPQGHSLFHSKSACTIVAFSCSCFLLNFGSDQYFCLLDFLSLFGFVGLRNKILTQFYNLGNDCNYFGLTPNSAWVCEIRALWYSGYVLLANIYELNVFQW